MRFSTSFFSCLAASLAVLSACDRDDTSAQDRDALHPPASSETTTTLDDDEETGTLGEQTAGDEDLTSQVDDETSADPSGDPADTDHDEASENDDDDDNDGDDNDDEMTQDGHDEDCVRTQGYWKNHSAKTDHGGPQNQKPWPISEDTLLCQLTWYDILQTPPAGGDAWYILAHQWIAASLNVASGAVPSADVQAALAVGQAFLEKCTISADDRAAALEAKDLLDAFNNGKTEHECPDDGDDDDDETTDDDDDDDDTTDTDETTTCEDDTNLPPGVLNDGCGENTDTDFPPG